MGVRSLSKDTWSESWSSEMMVALTVLPFVAGVISLLCLVFLLLRPPPASKVLYEINSLQVAFDGFSVELFQKVYPFLTSQDKFVLKRSRDIIMTELGSFAAGEKQPHRLKSTSY